MKVKEKENNVALYRKYRPEVFDDIIGQDHLVRAIKGSLLSGRVSHAYLLCGSRGTGKTTIARIIARELGTSKNDIYELDAASNRGIDDVRSIREGVNTMPFDSKYKVYILDEVHMFTKEAWNALLKTIEEPPAHVVFILATTELEKVPETIISRCQTFIFKKPTEAILSGLVARVAKQEGYKLESGGAELISLLATGAFRDALGILEKVISFSKPARSDHSGGDKNISLADIEEVTGAPGAILVNEFLDALANNDIKKGFSAIAQASEQNIDMQIYLKMILAKLRHALLLRYAPSAKTTLQNTISKEDLDYLENLIKNKPDKIGSQSLAILLEAYQSLRTAVISTLPLELALVKILEDE